MEVIDSWDALEEEFNQLVRSEAGHDRRVRVAVDLLETDPNHLVRTVFDGRVEVREKYIKTAIRAGKALGSGDNEDEALSRWLEHVISEAITERWGEGGRKWWCPGAQSYRGVVSHNTGVLDFLCLASAIACVRLARKARPTPPQPPPPPGHIWFLYQFFKHLWPLPPALPPAQYVRQDFPKWKYHATKEALIVSDRMAELALGLDWYDSPQALPVPSEPIVLPPSSESKPAKLPKKAAPPPSLNYRSPVKIAIRIILTNKPDASDLKVCRQMDDDSTDVPAKWKTRARSFEDMYKGTKTDRHRIESTIDKVRSDLRKYGAAQN